MSEDRTQTPSNLRRRQARDAGLVALSPELSAAAGLLAASALLGFFGDRLARGLVAAIKSTLLDTMPAQSSRGVVATVLHMAQELAWPILALLAATWWLIAVTHCAQSGLLWIPQLLAPDTGRLWTAGREQSLTIRSQRGVWTLLKSFLIAIACFWVLMSRQSQLAQLGRLGPSGILLLGGTLIYRLIWTQSFVLALIGLIELGLSRRRVEEMLHVTPEEQREDQKAVEGDPAVKSRRRHIAANRRVDAAHLLDRATMLVCGAGGVAVVVGGERPPGRIELSAAARGESGRQLTRAARRAGVLVVEDADLARGLSGVQRRAGSLAPEIVEQLLRSWPVG